MKNPTEEQIDEHIRDAAAYIDSDYKDDAYYWHGKTIDGQLITSKTYKTDIAALTNFKDLVAAELEMFQ